MRKISLKLCGFTCIMGIFGAFLRWMQMINISEPETNLVKPYSPWSFALVLFVILGSGLLIMYVRTLKNLDFPQKYPEVYSRGLPLYNVTSVIIGVLMALGGALMVFHALSSTRSVFDLVLGLFALVCALAVSFFVISANKTKKAGSGSAPSVLIILFLCFWLIAAYKFSASDPVIWHFAPRLLAIAATILAFYFVNGFVFAKPAPLLSLFFCLLGTFLCIITLADSYPMGEQLITLSFAALMTLLSFAQLNNAEKKD